MAGTLEIGTISLVSPNGLSQETLSIADDGLVTFPTTTVINGVTASEIGYLSGVTSSIQTQINGKSSTSHDHSGTYEPVITGGTTGQYWRGDKTWQTLPTPDLSAYATKDSPRFTGTITIPAGGSFSVTGQAPAYTCRAWVNFNGTGTVAIRGSGNVSSITDNGTGDYTVNFTTAMLDANYSVVSSTGNSANDTLDAESHATVHGVLTTSVRINVYDSRNLAFEDRNILTLAIFR